MSDTIGTVEQWHRHKEELFISGGGTDAQFDITIGSNPAVEFWVARKVNVTHSCNNTQLLNRSRDESTDSIV